MVMFRIIPTGVEKKYAWKVLGSTKCFVAENQKRYYTGALGHRWEKPVLDMTSRPIQHSPGLNGSCELVGNLNLF